MKYDKEEKKRKMCLALRDMCEMYVACDTFEQFMSEARSKYPHASKSVWLGFKMFYFKKTHPFLYPLAHLMFAFIFMGVASAIMYLFMNDVCFSILCAVLIYFSGLIVYMSSRVEDVMSTVSWFDDGCPTDY